MRMIVVSLLKLVFDIMYLLLVVRVFMQYLPQNRYTRLLKPVFQLTEPGLAKIRSGLPPSAIGFDASPFIAIVLLYFLQKLLEKLISVF